MVGGSRPCSSRPENAPAEKSRARKKYKNRLRISFHTTFHRRFPQLHHSHSTPTHPFCVARPDTQANLYTRLKLNTQMRFTHAVVAALAVLAGAAPFASAQSVPWPTDTSSSAAAAASAAALSASAAAASAEALKNAPAGCQQQMAAATAATAQAASAAAASAGE